MMKYAKAYVALAAATVQLVIATSDGTINLHDGAVILAAAVGALAVYFTPNTPPSA